MVTRVYAKIDDVNLVLEQFESSDEQAAGEKFIVDQFSKAKPFVPDDASKLILDKSKEDRTEDEVAQLMNADAKHWWPVLSTALQNHLSYDLTGDLDAAATGLTIESTLFSKLTAEARRILVLRQFYLADQQVRFVYTCFEAVRSSLSGLDYRLLGLNLTPLVDAKLGLTRTKLRNIRAMAQNLAARSAKRMDEASFKAAQERLSKEVKTIPATALFVSQGFDDLPIDQKAALIAERAKCRTKTEKDAVKIKIKTKIADFITAGFDDVYLKEQQGVVIDNTFSTTLKLLLKQVGISGVF